MPVAVHNTLYRKKETMDETQRYANKKKRKENAQQY